MGKVLERLDELESANVGVAVKAAKPANREQPKIPNDLVKALTELKSALNR